MGVKCAETDNHSKTIREWSEYGLASVREVKFQVPFEEPAIPIPSMGAVILADKILNVG